MKGFVTIIVAVLIVIILCWIGISVYDASNDVEINPNAEQYIKPIKPEFDLEAVDVVTEKIDKLPVSPKIFHLLDEQTNPEKLLDDANTEPAP
ncbi:hypothetical protein H6763_03530 [Candidatus Nomurabacteria bacterium]|mgnify:CR=1 FL=1|uniref:Uncharacterized protein n=1 Tax=Candidatus Dojkabacteria bacterium TaxID=2099670 RepID=A0A955I2V9_9BACT|nr:hypothetical protein [Candidatus Dojkabacteria bacterium]MCB9789616.1 hypothetical protein [Candidatus Nomurabacteria bacterium]MCB9803875.1 hypothetical protein [Candidatus Nomurabacteria bacterium]